MGKLRVLSGREICAILWQHGFAEVRQRGSYIIMQRTHGADTITVPVPNHAEMRRGTQQAIIRQSGLDRILFES